MSTYIRLVCTDHDPHLVAESESGQHLSDLPQIRADIRERDRIVANVRDGIWPSEYFRRNTAAFLSRHPRCAVAIEDEYGTPHPIREVWRIRQNRVTGKWMIFQPQQIRHTASLATWTDAWDWVTLDIAEGLIPA